MSQILPSLLEYSPEELQRKCQFLRDNLDEVLALTHNKTLSLHLDCVLPQFAADRSVMASLGLPTVFEVLHTIFPAQPLDLSIHLMGTAEDMVDMHHLFSQIELPAQWASAVFVSPQYFDVWSAMLHTFPHVKVGQWLDLPQWKSVNFQSGVHYLLMTVLAGKSGQKRQLEDRQQVIQIARLHPDSFFIFDGGWATSESVHVLNTSLVSYSHFWKTIGYYD